MSLTTISFYPPITPNLDIEFRDAETKALFDPDVVTFYLRPPGASTLIAYVVGTDPEAIKISTGKYRLQRVYRKDDAGVWKWHSEGDETVSQYGQFTILENLLKILENLPKSIEV